MATKNKAKIMTTEGILVGVVKPRANNGQSSTLEVTIPKEVREVLHIDKDTRFGVRIEGGRKLVYEILRDKDSTPK